MHDFRLFINVILLSPGEYFEKSTFTWIFSKLTHPLTIIVEFENENVELMNDKSPLINVSETENEIELSSIFAFPKIIIVPIILIDVLFTSKLLILVELSVNSVKLLSVK